MHQDKDIRAVILDVYGTMLISASGDIGQNKPNQQAATLALTQAGICIKQKDLHLTAKLILSELNRTVLKHHQIRMSEGIKFPEVDIRLVWHDILTKLNQLGTIETETDTTTCSRVAFLFELASNPVWPMPGLATTLGTLQKKKIPLGIVSNAQFFTPMTMRFFLQDKTPDENEIKHDINTPGFEEDLQSYSYRCLRAKPDTDLFVRLLQAFKEKYRLHPGQVLFVGNDMLKDILPASKTGFKTCLFAGDKRSLKMRKENKHVKSITPDFIITGLPQLLKIIKF
ncbi:MAG: HAD family hydrolase [Victivallales bacterium]|nr:HAD family hydrolase [Victivallales bacterium]